MSISMSTSNSAEDFCRDSGVLFVSLHQFPFYPGSGAATSVGEGNGRGCIVNVASKTPPADKLAC